MTYGYRWWMFFWVIGSSVLTAADHTKDSLEKVRELVATKKALLVDVREKAEWDAGHLEGAKLVPLSSLKGKLSDKQLRELFPPNKVIYLYCAGGFRCLEVAKMFEAEKLQLRALKPGYQTLLKEGFPIAPPEKEKPAPTGSKP
jgi:phage shock protein E